ncbi:MAG: hypothetical protein IJI98_04800 [Methanosphaera sp.]|uniref:hypothetical protein n=1 Tax=Methanosphaera sp. ISO3-F5 TaxID=1452353 RepID=UPI002B25810D|nr:hypothetical protein [Methanosphaera sp. ISO3-F5]MBR0471998.1 hypothetical protein [Methanosphaera sp.]WQH64622.1 hypothetical protein PXD04_02165 [Methanosphaera sp. ISO3-F5]
MQIITNDENKIIMFIKNNLEKYPEKVSYDIVREVLDYSETKMVDLLSSLQEKNILEFDSSTKDITYTNLDVDVKVVETKSELKELMLNQTEEDAYSIITDVISKYDNYAPRYILEGALMYGELELTPKRTYNIIVSLENKQLLKRVEKVDGEYYTI